MKIRIPHIAFAIALSTLVTLIAMIVGKFKQFNDSTALVDHTYQVIEQINNFETAAAESQVSIRGYLLMGDSSYLTRFYAAANSVPAFIDSCQELTKDNPIQEAHLLNLDLLLQSQFDHLESLAKKYPELGQTERQREMISQRGSIDSIRQIIKEMEHYEATLLRERLINKETGENSISNYMIILFLFSILIIFLAYYGLLRELRSRSRIQEQLGERNVSLAEYSKEMEEIAFASSHHLQEPTRKILTFLQLLHEKLKDKLDDEAENIFERTTNAGRNLLQLTQDISLYTSVENQREILEPQAVEPILMKEMQSLIAANKLQLQIDGELPKIPLYPNIFRIGIAEVIDNAIRYAKPGEQAKLRITALRLSADEAQKIGASKTSSARYIRLTFTDEGIGFHPNYAQKMMQIFQRLHPQDSSSATGIGLAIVRRVMAKHNGFLLAEGVEGRGASFHLYFPVK